MPKWPKWKREDVCIETKNHGAAALTKIIYLYRTGISTQSEYVDCVTAWLNG